MLVQDTQYGEFNPDFSFTYNKDSMVKTYMRCQNRFYQKMDIGVDLAIMNSKGEVKYERGWWPRKVEKTEYMNAITIALIIKQYGINI